MRQMYGDGEVKASSDYALSREEEYRQFKARTTRNLGQTAIA